MKNGKRGAALMFAIGMLTIVTLLASSVWGSIHLQTREAHDAVRAAMLRQLAEAGLEHARAARDRGMPLPLGEEVALGEGYYRLSAKATDDGQLTITSIGYLRDGATILAETSLSTPIRSATP